MRLAKSDETNARVNLVLSELRSRKWTTAREIAHAGAAILKIREVLKKREVGEK